MRKLFIMSLAVFFISLFGHAQIMNNPLVGAWQLAEIDDNGVVIYRDIIKVYTPSGLLKGIGNIQTENDGYMWLDGRYDISGDSLRGSYVEHCIWHQRPSFIGKQVGFYYNIDCDTLTISYVTDCNLNETWVRLGKQDIIQSEESNDFVESKAYRRKVKAYNRDKAKYKDKPFGLAGLWKRGSQLNISLGISLQSMKNKKQRFVEVDYDTSADGYVLFCEDGYVFEDGIGILPPPVNIEDSDNEASLGAIDVGVTKLYGYACEQYSVLSAFELGYDLKCGRASFHELCNGLYQRVLENSAGNIMWSDYYWKCNGQQVYTIQLSEYRFHELH